MNRLTELFDRKKSKVLNIYLTAGYPKLEDTVLIAKQLQAEGVDLIELGMPYSDPLADGPTIQKSSSQAIKNGMNLNLIFQQVKEIRKTVTIPIILMGYYNQLLQFGIDKFLDYCEQSGIDGLIIPDLPMETYLTDLKERFTAKNLGISFLVTPFTSIERTKLAASLSTAFLYVVSQSSITGSATTEAEKRISYYQKIKDLKLECNSLIGFGISDKASFDLACEFSNGAIIGSAFIKSITQSSPIESAISEFVKKIRVGI